MKLLRTTNHVLKMTCLAGIMTIQSMTAKAYSFEGALDIGGDSENQSTVTCDAVPQTKNGRGHGDADFKISIDSPIQINQNIYTACTTRKKDLLNSLIIYGALGFDLRSHPSVIEALQTAKSQALISLAIALTPARFRNSAPVCQAPSYPGSDTRTVKEGLCPGGIPRKVPESFCDIRSEDLLELEEDARIRGVETVENSVKCETRFSGPSGDGTLMCGYSCTGEISGVSIRGVAEVTARGKACFQASPVCVSGW